MSFRVRLTAEAAADLERLIDFIVQRELERESGDFLLADQALDAIKAGLETLKTSPFTCRKVGASPFLRELVIAFGHTGYVALFEIQGESDVVIAAVRHQREDDYH